MKPRSDAMAACMAIIVYFARIKNKGFNVLLNSLLGGRHPHTCNYFNCMFQIFLFFRILWQKLKLKLIPLNILSWVSVISSSLWVMEWFIQCVIFLVLWKGFGKHRAKQNTRGNQYSNYHKLVWRAEKSKFGSWRHLYSPGRGDSWFTHCSFWSPSGAVSLKAGKKKWLNCKWGFGSVQVVPAHGSQHLGLQHVPALQWGFTCTLRMQFISQLSGHGRDKILLSAHRALCAYHGAFDTPHIPPEPWEGLLELFTTT